MDGYQAATNWLVFGVVVTAAAYYYWPRGQRRTDRRQSESGATARRRRSEQLSKRPTSEHGSDGDVAGTDPRTYAEVAAKKRKPLAKPAARSQEPSAVLESAPIPEETDMNTRQWAAQMQKTRAGLQLGSQQRTENRVKTVKQRSAANTSVLSPDSLQTGADADDDMSPPSSPSRGAGDVSDMLEAAAAGPSVLRVTAPSKPQKERASRPTKEQEPEETKKQRQNRKKVEERRVAREEEERARKALEERQRRTAREARGEPAKNGLGVSSKPPASNAWTAATSTSKTNGAPPTNGSTHDPALLDTFDAESTASSTGGPDPSTAATSTSDGDTVHVSHDLPSEEEQLAHAVKQSEDESGWQTVALPKKSKKKADAAAAGAAAPTLTNTTNGVSSASSKSAANGKPKGFQALDAQYEQRADADPSDASNWDA